MLINGQGEERVARALSELRAQMPEATFDGIAADLATAEGADAVAAKAPVVDILVNNVTSK